jgi:protein-tyrosine kinase
MDHPKSLIEQAATRLEELRRAGADAPSPMSQRIGEPAKADSVHDRVPTPEAAVRELTRGKTPTPAFARARIDVADAAVTRKSAASPRSGTPASVAEIDFERLRALGFITPDAPRSQLADELRVIKRPIMRNALGASGIKVRDGNLVMVTSALPREGKTFTAVNLAMTLATELDTTVLLVDGDVAHPSLPQLLDVPRSPGLLDLLTNDDLDVGDALVRTNIENLSVLPAGSNHRRATELLASEQMTALLRELATRYSDRIIVFDSPPLLATTEARVMATHMGQIIMVVAADSTLQSEVNLALSTIERCEIVLMMLNKADKTEIGAYYGYYAADTD